MTEVGQAVVSDDERDWGSPRAKTVQWYDPAIIAAAAGQGLSGLEFLRAIRDGKLPPAPIAALMGFRPVEVEPGRVVFEGTPDESVCRADILDGAGKVVATATSSCLVMPATAAD